MTETERLALVARVTDKIGREGKDAKFTFSTVRCHVSEHISDAR